jgi:hypothetical protein
MTVKKEEVTVERAESLFVAAFGAGVEGTTHGIKVKPADRVVDRPATDPDAEFIISLHDADGRVVATNGFDDGIVFSRDALKELREDIAELLGLEDG